MSEKYYKEQGIEKVLIRKETLKAAIIGILVCVSTALTTFLIMNASLHSPDRENNWTGYVPPSLYPIVFQISLIILAVVGVLAPIVIITITRAYMVKYVNSFKYKLTNSALEIVSGVFNKNKVLWLPLF